LVKGAKVKAVPGSVPAGASVKYQWLRNGKAIKGASAKTYKVATADAAKKLAVRVQVRVPGKSNVTQTSLARAVSKAAKAVKARNISISGTAEVGAVLKAKAGKWSPKATKLSYQWTRDGWNIAGANKAAYRISSKDAGSRIGLVVIGKAHARGSAVAVATGKLVPVTSAGQAPPAPTPPANQPPPPAPPTPPASPDPAPPAPPVVNPPDDPKPNPTPSTPTPDPDPTKPVPPPAAGPTEVPGVAFKDGPSFVAGPTDDAGGLEITKDNLSTLKFRIPAWYDANKAPVPEPQGKDQVVIAIYGNLNGPAYLTTPVYTVADLKTWGVIEKGEPVETEPDSPYPPVKPGLPGPGENLQPQEYWVLVPGAGLTDDQVEGIKSLPTGKYTVKMTVIKAHPATTNTSGYTPLVATWPLNWTNASPALMPVNESKPDQKIPFKVPSGTLTAASFNTIQLPIPPWTDIFNQPFLLAPTDHLKHLGMCKDLAEDEAEAAAEEPDPDAQAGGPTSDACGDGLASIMDAKWDNEGPLVSELAAGESIQGQFASQSLFPMSLLISASLRSGTGIPGVELQVEPSQDASLEALEELKKGTYYFRAIFTREGYRDMPITWKVDWTPAKASADAA
jgi:hypothetical protein